MLAPKTVTGINALSGKLIKPMAILGLSALLAFSTISYAAGPDSDEQSTPQITLEPAWIRTSTGWRHGCRERCLRPRIGH